MRNYHLSIFRKQLVPVAVACLLAACQEKPEVIPDATFSSVSPAAGAKAGEQLTISGSHFGESPTEVTVTVGRQTAEVVSVANDQIIVIQPELDPGEYDLSLMVREKPVALNSRVMVLPFLEVEPYNGQKFVPFQVIELPIANAAGTPSDYRLLFGSTEMVVSQVTDSGLEVIIPGDATPGTFTATLYYESRLIPAGEVEIEDPADVFGDAMAVIELEDPEHPYLFIDPSQSVIVPRVQNGALASVAIATSDGSSTQVEFDETGLPLALYNNKVKIIFDGYNLDEGTVNLGYYFNDDTANPEFAYAVPLDLEQIGALQDLRTARLQGRYTETTFLQALSLSMSIVGCASSVIAIPTGIGIVTTGISCATAIYDIYSYLNPEYGNATADMVSAGAARATNVWGCASIAIRPTNAAALISAINSCAALPVELAGDVEEYYDELQAQDAHQEVVEQLRAILASGFGDIKVTLTWDTDADIDLWVTDPSGTRIWYSNSSSSTGGELDLDDTDGHGPENIYWPSNESPFGTYTVQIHYYGPSNGPVTNCTVRIFNFGQQTTYQQALTPDGLATIAVFEAGQSSGGRFKAALVETVPANLLPKKH